MKHPTVIKLGGSLFDLSDLGERLQRLLKVIDSPTVIIPGGGALADVVRDWDQRHSLGEVTAHRLALQTMSLTAQLVASFSRDFALVDGMNGVTACWSDAKTPVLDVAPLYLTSDELPQSWRVTSDSIAARVARKIPNAKLLLVKSTMLPTPLPSLTAAAQQGLVDQHFPIAAAGGLSVWWCDLRNELAGIDRWIAANRSSH